MMKTAEFFFINPSRDHYLMDISRNTGLSHTSTKKNLKGLIKLGMINEHSEKKGERSFPFYKANVDNKLFRKHKLVYNLSAVIESGLADFIEDQLAPKSVVLFGSYSRGEDVEDSDIDLFVECKTSDIGLKAFEKKLKRKIGLHFAENFNSYPKELKNNVINSTVFARFF